MFGSNVINFWLSFFDCYDLFRDVFMYGVLVEMFLLFL